MANKKKVKSIRIKQPRNRQAFRVQEAKLNLLENSEPLKKIIFGGR